MPFASRLLSVIALTLLSASASAATTTHTSQAGLLSQLAGASYFNDFNNLADPPAGPAAFSGNGFAYSAFAPSDIYLAGGFLGASDIDEDLVITFTSGNVTAFGANFFATDFNDDLQAITVMLMLDDGTTEVFTPTSQADSYRGFVSTSAITSITISGYTGLYYPGLDNLTVGSTQTNDVPEPAGLALVGVGLAGLLAARRRPA